jgi:hypothetical protein
VSSPHRPTNPPSPESHRSIHAMANELARLSVAELQQRYADLFGESTSLKHKAQLIKRILWRVQAVAQGGLSERARQIAAGLASEADLRLTAPAPARPRQEAAAANEQASPSQRPKTVLRAAVRTTPEADELPPPGGMIKRVYKGRTLIVRVLPDGFLFEGQQFASLTAIARHVTGSHWNGRLFFGLTQGRSGSARPAPSLGAAS